MSSLNKCHFIGRLGRDPEIRHTQDGKAVANFSIATSEKWKNKNGEQQEKTEWISCVAFEKLAEIIEKFVSKGSLIYVEGKFTTRKWQDKNGQDRYTTEINVKHMQMLSGKSDSKPTQDVKTVDISDLDKVPFDDEVPF